MRILRVETPADKTEIIQKIYELRQSPRYSDEHYATVKLDMGDLAVTNDARKSNTGLRMSFEADSNELQNCNVKIVYKTFKQKYQRRLGTTEP
ncbi:hypothetical protein CHS0354_008441 [Potamilus streckersoni]|uniref:Uncharacterized protein n=1 Tax=Potamilus streckersoni TaxID=2493646 RepID=A0AAE0RPT0_9BIVA|nr:hypothetical protein CHS0354_008441 [Potamilus streckersoni]